MHGATRFRSRPARTHGPSKRGSDFAILAAELRRWFCILALRKFSRSAKMEAGRLSAKSVLVAALIAVLLGACFLAIARPAFFASWTNLAALIAIEVFLLALWRYEQFFLPVLLVAFLWAGLDLPFARQWDAARWVVL